MLSDGRLTRKEHDLLKELVIRKDPDLLEVASVITHPDDIDSGNLKELNKYFKNKLEVFMREAFTKLYSRVTQDDAYTIANQSTLRMDPDDSQEFTYGEVDFESFSEILTVAVAGLEQRRKFVDLGHGTGKAVLMVSLPFTQVLLLLTWALSRVGCAALRLRDSNRNRNPQWAC